jgi:hypothetical protein
VTKPIEHIQAFLDWKELQLLEGLPNDLASYEEHLRVLDMEDRLDQISALASGGLPGEAPAAILSMIAGLSHVA